MGLYPIKYTMDLTAGTACSLGWFATAYICYTRRIRHSCAMPHPLDLMVFSRMRGSARIRMLCSGNVSTPMLIGVIVR